MWGMHACARLTSGTLTMESVPGAGTRVKIRLVQWGRDYNQWG